MIVSFPTETLVGKRYFNEAMATKHGPLKRPHMVGCQSAARGGPAALQVPVPGLYCVARLMTFLILYFLIVGPRRATVGYWLTVTTSTESMNHMPILNIVCNYLLLIYGRADNYWERLASLDFELHRLTTCSTTHVDSLDYDRFRLRVICSVAVYSSECTI